MDRIQDSGSYDMGSIPVGTTSHRHRFARRLCFSYRARFIFAKIVTNSVRATKNIIFKSFYNIFGHPTAALLRLPPLPSFIRPAAPHLSFPRCPAGGGSRKARAGQRSIRDLQYYKSRLLVGRHSEEHNDEESHHHPDCTVKNRHPKRIHLITSADVCESLFFLGGGSHLWCDPRSRPRRAFPSGATSLPARHRGPHCGTANSFQNPPLRRAGPAGYCPPRHAETKPKNLFFLLL